MPKTQNEVQDLITVENVLKKEYLPFINNMLNVEANPFLEMIQKDTLTASSGKFGARIGIGGGFGMSQERQRTPNAYAPIYEKFDYTSKDAYVDIKISNKDLVLARSNMSAFIDTVQDAMDASYEAAKWNVSRMLFGDGTGVVAKCTAQVTTGSNVITVDDTSKLIEGLVVDLHSPSGSSADAPSTSAAQIISIDHVGKKVTLSKNPTANLSAGESGAYALVTVQNSYNREITGLGAIFDDKVKNIYGISKAENAWVKPYSYDAKNDIDDTKLTDAITFAKDKKRAEIDLIMAGDEAFRAYQYYMKESAHNYQLVKERRFVGGAAGYEVLFGDHTATIVRNSFVPTNSMWGVDTKQFTLRETKWDFAQHQGSVFVLQPETSVHRALLADYLELICKNPGGCVEIKNCNALGA